MSPHRHDSENDARLEQVLAEYLRALEAGERRDEQALIAAHPELAGELRSFFANRAALERVAEPLRGAANDVTLGLAGDDNEATRVRYFGDFELLDELGRGGMGVVYRARQTTLNRVVALKMILAGQLAAPDDVRRFKQEAEAAANLDHPHIAPIYETGEHDGQHYFSMKLIEGRSLREALPELRDDVRGGVTLLAQVARAIHHAHQRGVLHRDLKPANVLLDRDGTPYVTDFGLAKRVEGGSGVTRTGVIVGTPSYMSPEQALGQKQLSTAVDVYSLGAILYELLTGRPPFRADSPLETLLQVAGHDVVRPRTLNASADRDLETIALKCLEKDATRRYDSATALADDLTRWLRGEPIVARRASLLERSSKWARRKPAAAALAALSIVVPLVLIVVLAVSRGNINRALDNERRVSTFSRVALAHSEWLQGNVARADQHLDHCPTDLRGWEWRYLKRLCHSELLSVPAGNASGSLAFSPDGRLLAIALAPNWRLDDPANIVVVDVDTGKQVRTLSGHGKFFIYNLSFDRASRRLAASGQRRVTVWDVAQDRPIYTRALPADDHGYWTSSPAALNPDGKLLAWAVNDRVEVRELATDKEVLAVPNTGTAVAFTSDGTGILVNAFERVERKKQNLTFHGHRGLQLRELATGKVLRTMAESSRLTIEHVAVSPDGRYVAADDGPYTENDIRVWDIAAGQLVARLAAAGDQVGFSQDGRRIAALHGVNNTATVWSVAGHRLATVRGVRRLLAFHPDGQRIAGFDSVQKSVCIWDSATAQESTHMDVPATPECLAFSRDGREVAIAVDRVAFESVVKKSATEESRTTVSKNAVTVWDVAKRVRARTIATIPDDAGRVRDIAWSPDGTFVAGVTSRNGAAQDPPCELKIWNATDGRESLSLQCPPESRLKFVAISPDSRLIAFGGAANTVEVVEVAGGRVLQSIPVRAVRAAFHPDSRQLAVGARSVGPGPSIVNRDHVEIWDLERGTRQLLFDLDPTIGDPPNALAYSLNGRYLAAANATDVFVWNAAGGRLVSRLRGEMPRSVCNIAFTPDGERLAVATTGVTSPYETGTLNLWDVRTAQVVLSLHGPAGPTERIAFSPDGHRLACAVSGAVYFWDATPLPPPPHAPD